MNVKNFQAAAWEHRYIALSDLEIKEEFFNAATLSREPYEIAYEGQSQVTIDLDDDLSSGKVTISYNFDNFLRMQSKINGVPRAIKNVRHFFVVISFPLSNEASRYFLYARHFRGV